MDALTVVTIPVLRDNYVHVLHDPATGVTAAVDPAVAPPVLEAVRSRGWRLTHVLCTHHHPDHTAGNAALREATGCEVVGARADRHRIPAVTALVEDGDMVTLGSITARVLAVPGHTTGHVAYVAGDVVFCGDTLFSLGCGRLFEGTAAEMWASLCRLRALPDATRVYCGHEYTEANGRFAVTVDPHNPALGARVAEVAVLRAEGLPTVPSTLAVEQAANPFLRADDPALASALGLTDAPPAVVFAALRSRKDVF